MILSKIRREFFHIWFRTNVDKKGDILLSYIFPISHGFIGGFGSLLQRVFGREKSFHQNQNQLSILISVLTELGYDVCLVDRMSKRTPKKKFDYNIITNSNLKLDKNMADKTIFYSAEPCSMQRIISEKKEIEYGANKWGIERRMLRDCDPNDDVLVKMVRLTLVTGYTWSESTFSEKDDVRISQLPITVPYMDEVKACTEIDRYNKKNIVWIGAGGWLLKGFNDVVDLAVLYADYDFYVIGKPDNNIDIEKISTKLPNIKFTGFLNPLSGEFKEIMGKSSIALCTSRSEAGYGSGLACIIYGCYPVYRKESSFHESILGVVVTDDLAIAEAFEKAVNIPADEKKHQVEQNIELVKNKYTNDSYKSKLINELSVVLR